ncbi:isocitrate/isopropylmalate dehydrogenase family protein [Candidatus Nitrosocosmicus hydrocola]|uniref:isocitrate/isopropylmalate dehydrogenase family protein n=1 Tax=Candidatus Nitrosocosmicus hydrocola TaxID=1826872 RepID=UPI000B188B33|nr:isocitrate/isopropylmalate dehydrogenase family protein [Candidatus Nitrosocosmicus hydrocola]
MTTYEISLLVGDGIGPELSLCAAEILQYIHDKSARIKFKITRVEAGDNAKQKYGNALPIDTFEEIKKSQACLKSPVGESAADVVLVLRRYFDLYANVRPSKNYANVPSISKNVDLVTVRENTEDLYLGWEFLSDDDTVISLRKISRNASKRIAEHAFKIANSRKGKKVTIVHKSNVLRLSDRMFIDTSKEVSKRFPNIEFEEMYVDACSMELIRYPNRFDTILTTNLFGDIISDEAAQVTGSIGLAPAANIGDNFAMFEPVHGAAFDIAGKNIANPTSFILAIKMMFDWLGEKYHDNDILELSINFEKSIDELFTKNVKTKDIGGSLSTLEFNQKFLNILNDKGFS